MATATSETICKYNQSGFCRYGSHCRKQHNMDICMHTQWTMETCVKTHPRMCKYFTNFGKCKFSDSCAYIHINKTQALNDKIVKQKVDLENEIKQLRAEIEDLAIQVSDLKSLVSLNCDSQSQKTIESNLVPS